MPPLCHSRPNSPAVGLASELGHTFTFSSAMQKHLGSIHWLASERVTILCNCGLAQKFHKKNYCHSENRPLGSKQASTRRLMTRPPARAAFRVAGKVWTRGQALDRCPLAALQVRWWGETQSLAPGQRPGRPNVPCPRRIASPKRRSVMGQEMGGGGGRPRECHENGSLPFCYPTR